MIIIALLLLLSVAELLGEKRLPLDEAHGAFLHTTVAKWLDPFIDGEATPHDRINAVAPEQTFMARLDDQSASALTDALQAFIDVRFTDQSYSRLLTVKLVQKVQADPTSLTTDLAVQLACIAVDLENCGCDMRAERGGARFVEGLRRQLEARGTAAYVDARCQGPFSAAESDFFDVHGYSQPDGIRLVVQ